MTLRQTPTRETCARCGHTVPRCHRCRVNVPYLGGWGANGQRYCHTFVEGRGPTCYTLASWEWTEDNVRPVGPALVAGKLTREVRTRRTSG